ncbi:PREDICTED: uncharacterized protein LOC108563647 [Nicrophorus vespilloides]|uniref:Uncharacterized protein LOC108563647 n=1 Tax=Nicrophorus vespilloides TaxID=110193 RepID=A0ABM1MTH6_NICVS|nr:PREDICTED: uncharacterized protein LOC108563647 [Nicrophorus vespilloides]
MKLLAFALCCSVLSQQAISQESVDINDQIAVISNCLRKILQNGLPDFGIPILDPLNSSQISVDLASFGIDIVSGTLVLKNLILQGLADFDLEDVDISINGNALTLKFNLIEPSISFNSDYNFNALIYVLPIIGNGKLSVILSDLVASVDITANLQIGNIQVENFQISPTIGNLNVS